MDFIDKFNQFINRIGTDKVMHFETGAIIATWIILGWAICGGLSWATAFYPLAFSAVVVIVVECFKEILDDRFSVPDLLVTMAGWLSGVVYTAILLAFS